MTDKQEKKIKKQASKKKKADAANFFPIVGIGSSAGGLEALEKFFTNMPVDFPIAFVIIQHLSPKYKSIMASLLARYTPMEVLEIKDGMKVEPNRVYLTPPNKNVIISRRILFLKEPIKTHGVNLPIDIFFRSLSEDLRERAICIILSGTATDGTLGIKTVKGGGGIAMVQSPESAKYDGMPRCAIATGLVDFVLPVEEIPRQLIKYIRHPYLEITKTTAGPETLFNNYMQEIFTMILAATGHDFSSYKQNTIRRRIERRMAVHQLDKMSEYILYIRKNRLEIDALFKDLLIGVTNFFRDAEAFDILENQVLPDFLENRSTDAPVRIWVVGCSTGEEAYSLAIIFSEVMEKVKKIFNIQVFASDIDAEAIDYARLGVYPASIAADVSPERLDRFFLKEDNSYKIKKQIREMVVFAIQSIIKDPPFSRMDMVSCRNLLIYMDTPLQKRILPLFAYTIKPNGILFLGTSESVGEFSESFPPIIGKWKIFKHKGSSGDRYLNYLHSPFSEFYPGEIGDDLRLMPKEIDIYQQAERIILENYAPPGVLIDDRNQVVQFIGQTDLYLSTPTGKASFDILKMAREGLRFKLTSAIRAALRQEKMIQYRGVRIKYNNEFRIVDLLVQPLRDKTLPKGFMLVLFYDKTADEQNVRDTVKTMKKDDSNPTLVSLEQELNSTKEYLQTTIEELETSNEELKSTNEELQSVNEELQSANEELETSKEELQSTNEELVTVNTELQKKVEELSQLNNDINNLLASTEIGTIFLDTRLCIKRFTPAATRIFNLIQTDIGRLISDITTKIDFENLAKSAERVLASLEKIEVETKSDQNTWYSIRIAPYRTQENVIEGVVITFMDISRIKQSERVLEESGEKRRLFNEQSSDFIMILDRDTNVCFTSRNFGSIPGEQIVGNPFCDYVPEKFRPVIKACFEGVIKTGEPQQYKIDYPIPGDVHTVEGDISAIKHAGQVVALVVKSKTVKG